MPSSLYEHNYVTTKDIKVAGKDRASKVFADIYKGSVEAKEEFWKRAEYYKDKHPESFTKAFDEIYEKYKNEIEFLFDLRHSICAAVIFSCASSNYIDPAFKSVNIPDKVSRIFTRSQLAPLNLILFVHCNKSEI